MSESAFCLLVSDLEDAFTSDDIDGVATVFSRLDVGAREFSSELCRAVRLAWYICNRALISDEISGGPLRDSADRAIRRLYAICEAEASLMAA